ncbi:MAG: TIGR00725 family protein [Deltaproteobacteria bacterium]|nr:TIGR00725 family protein [Deltaproteobacteria bacterium]
MGGGKVDKETARMATELGRRVAEAGYVLLTGGRPAGVMDAASQGAHQAQGLVIGILPGPDPDDSSAFVDIVIATNLADGRNLINILSSDVVIACPGGAGTLTEVGMAIKNKKPLVLLNFDPGPTVLDAESQGRVIRASTPTEAMAAVQKFMEKIKS